VLDELPEREGCGHMVSLTRQAAEKIRLSKGESKYARLKVTCTDVNCVSYCIDYTNKVNNDDILYMSYGIKILVGSMTRKYFEDLKVDFVGSNGDVEFIYDSTEVLAAEI
jgi:Fe-S cluster assembly iron-binding protein IscA